MLSMSVIPSFPISSKIVFSSSSVYLEITQSRNSSLLGRECLDKTLA